MNVAISNALKELEREENNQRFIEMVKRIEPVKTELSSEDMVRLLRDGKDIPISK